MYRLEFPAVGGTVLRFGFVTAFEVQFKTRSVDISDLVLTLILELGSAF